MSRHIHYEAIVAYANGAQIEFRDPCNPSHPWTSITAPCFSPLVEYRIKPEPKPDVVGYIRALNPVEGHHSSYCSMGKSGGDNIKCTFDGETGKLKKVEIVNA